MQFKISREPITTLASDCIIITHTEDKDMLLGLAKEVDEKMDHRISQLIAEKEIKGKFGEVTLLHTWGKIPAKRVLVLGLGKEEKLTLEKARSAYAIAARKAQEIGVSELTLAVSQKYKDIWNPVDLGQAVVEGIVLGTYQFKPYKTKTEIENKIERVIISVKDISIDAVEAGVVRGEIFAESQNLARDFSNEPANKMTPTILAEKAKEIAKKHHLEISILEKEQLEELNMGAFLAVSKGSTEPPKMIVIKYIGAPDSKDMIGLVGKGITFDSGGIQIKPDKNMDEMKGDMAGAAAVLGAINAIGALKPHVNVIGVISACENMVSGEAVHPGDVVETFSGKTVEIKHTDAEGRLILSDAISYAKHLGATKLVDVATLTGSIISALGHHIIGLFSNNMDWTEEVKAAAKISGEKVWELPLDDDYAELIESDIADMVNDAGSPAGAIQGGMFLKEFAGETPWVHLDIAGTSDVTKTSGINPKGATGVAVRTMIALVLRFSGN
ncbi:leucyl aminopeptidase [Vulcanibacillus modesticaldus]|uniref:Probable cytosol aminopeptidase n=1 Tax=Vulcanibacillus modesticaldus TaxID=337097 RepID=A0A1D2YUE7_9BACI|nr:leucyl aminopeptidase [Vulcanibacillus modesticaldus]OEF99293.1 leucyl aminopeptidase [Vulcanibacillus modesticaldus]